MSQKILVAVDDSQNAQRAVAFVARSFSKANKVTLFTVLLDTAALCEMDSPELTPLFRSQQSNFCALEDKKRELVTQATDRARQVLVEAGFDEQNVEIKIKNKKHSVARDIIDEAKNGYDLIVIGRHGVSGVKDFFLGSITQKVFSGAKDMSVLIAN